MKKLVLLLAALLVASCGEKSLSDSAIEKALEKAVELETLQERNDLYYQVNKTKPYSGWAKVLYDSGQAEQLFGIKDGKREGRTLAWEDDGTKTFEATYKDGALDGYFELSEDYSGSEEGWPNFDEFDGLGVVRVIGTIKDGKKDGKWTSYYENEQKAEEMRFKDDTRDGACSMWYENGQKAVEGGFKNGNIHGTFTFWNEDGEQAGEGHYKDGDGSFTRSYPNGQKSAQGSYKDSNPDGAFTAWHENGQKFVEGTYKEGKKDGLWTEWYENGQKQVEGTYKVHKKDGLHTLWHENGQKAEEVTYKDGEEVSAKYWNSKGEEVESLDEAKK